MAGDAGAPGIASQSHNLGPEGLGRCGSLAERSSQSDLGKGLEPDPSSQPSKTMGALGPPQIWQPAPWTPSFAVEIRVLLCLAAVKPLQLAVPPPKASSHKLLPVWARHFEHSLGASTGRLFPSAEVIR